MITAWEAISVYGNAARSVRSLAAAPSLKSRSLSEGVIRAYSAAFSDGQGTNPAAQESTTSRHERMCGMGSTHQQPLQAQSDISVVSTQAFIRAPLTKRRGPPIPCNRPRSSSSRPSSPTPYLSRETDADARPSRSSEPSMKYFLVKHSPIRGKSKKSLLNISRMASSSTRVRAST